MGRLHSVYTALKSFCGTALLFVQRLMFGEKELPEQPGGEGTNGHLNPLQSLPVELHLHIFSFLELKPYIISHGVCKEWQRLLPLVPLHPIRSRMFTLYRKMISDTPNFANTRPWTVENLRPFDRQAYIDALLTQYPAIPEAFRTWILEWPDRLALAATWRALPFTDCRY